MTKRHLASPFPLSLILVGTLFGVLLCLLLSPPPSEAQFLPPGALNPFADEDLGADVFVSHLVGPDLTIHAVWASKNPYVNGAGGDPDIFYSRNVEQRWSAPILVNSYGESDGGSDERLPRLAIGPDGSLHCVWQSQVDYQSAGADWDIFYSKLDASSSAWSPAEHVSDAAGALNDDVEANLAVRGDGAVLVLYQSDYGNRTSINWTVRKGSSWSTPLFKADSAEGPAAMTTTADGDVIAVWVERSVPTNLRTLVMAEYQQNGFTQEGPINTLMTSSTADHYGPAVATFGSGHLREVHIVWSSNENLDGIGTDYDLLHQVKLEIAPHYLGPFPVNSSAGFDTANDRAPSLCFEPGGILHVAWESDLDFFSGTDWDVYHADNATAGSEWSGMGFLGLNSFFDGPGEHDNRPDLACASNHILSGAWQSNYDRDDTTPNGADTDILHALGLGRLYHRPTPITYWARSDLDSDSDVHLAQNSAQTDGVLHAVWTSEYPGGGGLSFGSDSDIFHSELSSHGWSPVELVNTTGLYGADGRDQTPDVFVDRQGRVHVVWSSDSDDDSSGSDFDIFYSVRAGSTWTAPELVNVAGVNDPGIDDHLPRLTVDDTGVVHVVWRAHAGQDRNLRYSSRTNSGWSPSESPATLDGSFGPRSHDISSDAFGTVHLVWFGESADFGSDTDIFYSTRAVSRSWTTPRLVNDYGDSDGWDDVDPVIAFAANGDPIVVWAGYEDVAGAGTDSDLLVSRLSAQGFSAALPLLTRGKVGSAGDRQPAIAVAGDRLHVAWTSVDGLDFDVLGTDSDILHAEVSLSDGFPSSAFIGAVNSNAYGDSGLDESPTMVVTRTGVVLFAWDTTDTLGGLIGGDRDVLTSRLGDGDPVAIVLMADDYERGDLLSW